LPFTLCPPFGGCGVGAAVENMPAVKKRKGKEPFNALALSLTFAFLRRTAEEGI
jgi:hypothetical protein